MNERVNFNPEIINPDAFGGEAKPLIEALTKNEASRYGVESLAPAARIPRGEAGIPARNQEMKLFIKAAGTRDNLKQLITETRNADGTSDLLALIGCLVFPKDEKLAAELMECLYKEGNIILEGDLGKRQELHQEIMEQLAVVDFEGQGAGEGTLLNRCLRIMILEKQKGGSVQTEELERAWKESQGAENPSAAVVIEEFNRQMEEITGEKDSWAEIKADGIIVTKEIFGKDRQKTKDFSAALQKILDLAGGENPVEVVFQEALYLTDAVIRGGEFQDNVYLEGQSLVIGGSFSNGLNLDDSSLFVGGEIKGGDIYISGGFNGVILFDGKVYVRENINRGHSGFLWWSGEIDITAIGKDKLRELDARIINLSEEEDGVEVERQKATIINKGREVIIFVPRDGGWEWHTAGTIRRDGLFSSSELRDKLAEVGLKLGAILPEAAIVAVPVAEEKAVPENEEKQKPEKSKIPPIARRR